MARNMVQYLHVRILKFPLTIETNSMDVNGAFFNQPSWIILDELDNLEERDDGNLDS